MREMIAADTVAAARHEAMRAATAAAAAGATDAEAAAAAHAAAAAAASVSASQGERTDEQALGGGVVLYSDLKCRNLHR